MIANVKRFQRVLQICASVDTAQALLGLGLDSAAKIAMLGQKQFFSKASAAGISNAESDQVYANAEHLYATAISLISQNHSGLTNVWPAALGNNPAHAGAIPQAVKTSPSLQTLFGPQDFCAVDPATSMLSPAAYLTDLLMWLRRRDPAAAYTTLRNRRPDIPLTMLNAANTFTELPYIDVVNELLEDAVAPPKSPVRKVTTLTAAELRAAPEYVNAEAYAILAKASFPTNSLTTVISTCCAPLCASPGSRSGRFARVWSRCIRMPQRLRRSQPRPNVFKSARRNCGSSRQRTRFRSRPPGARRIPRRTWARSHCSCSSPALLTINCSNCSAPHGHGQGARGAPLPASTTIATQRGSPSAPSMTPVSTASIAFCGSGGIAAGRCGSSISSSELTP